MDEPLQMWVVHQSPDDYPDMFVVRKWLIDGKTEYGTLTNEVHLSATLEGIRQMIPEGLYRIPRMSSDYPSIVEVWF